MACVVLLCIFDGGSMVLLENRGQRKKGMVGHHLTMYRFKVVSRIRREGSYVDWKELSTNKRLVGIELISRCIEKVLLYI